MVQYIPTVSLPDLFQEIADLQSSGKLGYGTSGLLLLERAGVTKLTLLPVNPREPVPADAKWYTKAWDALKTASEEHSRRRWSLTPFGRGLYHLYYVLGDKEQAKEAIANALRHDNSIDLVTSTFMGRGRIKSDQVDRLLRLNGYFSTESERTAFLTLLHDAGLIKLSRRWMTFEVVASAEASIQVPERVLLLPESPFTNRRRLEQILSLLDGSVLWVDKHFRREGLEFIVYWMPPDVEAVTIISGPENAKREQVSGDLDAAKRELSAKGTELHWMVCRDKALLDQVHDRWVVGARYAFNVPPVLSILKDQAAEITRTDNPPIDLIRRLLEASTEFV